MQGPVAKIVSVIIIIVTGLTLAFGETSGGFRRLIQIVFGLSIAFAASSFFLSFFQFGGGAWSMMEQDAPSRLRGAGPPRADRADPARRCAARVAIVNGTLAAAVGLGLRLWIVGGLIWLIGHPAAVWAAKRDPHSSTWCAGISAIRSIWSGEGGTMMNLAEYRSRSQSLADFLPWAALVGEGVILNKDGSFQRTASSAAPISIDAGRARRHDLAAEQRAAPSRLGLGDLHRGPAPTRPQLPDQRVSRPTSGLVDAERRAQFEEEGAHFESRYS